MQDLHLMNAREPGRNACGDFASHFGRKRRRLVRSRHQHVLQVLIRQLKYQCAILDGDHLKHIVVLEIAVDFDLAA